MLSVQVCLVLLRPLAFPMTWLTDLIEKAKKATGGPWRVGNWSNIYAGDNPNPIAGFFGSFGASPESIKNSEFVASAYPERIIALGEVVEAAKVLKDVCVKYHARQKHDKTCEPECVDVSVALMNAGDALTRLEALGDK